MPIKTSFELRTAAPTERGVALHRRIAEDTAAFLHYVCTTLEDLRFHAPSDPSARSRSLFEAFY